MRVLVTGCGGYVGHQVARGLAAAGHRVIGTSRRPLVIDGCEILIGDLTDPAFLARGLERADAVLHLAARTRGHEAAAFERDNEHVTRELCRVAQRLGRPLIFISSDQAVYQTGFYGRSKRACEEIVRHQHRNYCIVRLSAVLGRYAPDMASTFSRIIQRLDCSRWILMPGDGRVDIAPVWIGDVTTVLRRLIALPELPCETFEACGDTIHLRHLVDLFEARLAVDRLRIAVPRAPLQGLARVLKPFSVFARLPLDALMDLGRPIGVSYRSLGERIGFEPTPMTEAVPQIEDFPSRHVSAARSGAA